MTTNDPFAEARAYAEQACYQDENRPIAEAGFRAGWDAARTHLSEQEPTDAECIAVLNAVTAPLGEKPKDTEWFPAAIQRCRETMMSARAARRDEEKR